MQGEATVKELTEPFSMSQPAISRHLKVLEEAGLIEGGKKAQARPRKLRALPMRFAYDWLDEYRQTWEFKSSRLDKVLSKIRTDHNHPSD